MIVRSFLAWAATAPAASRAEATAALAAAYADHELDPGDRREAEAALIAMLDDPAPAVRLAMAEILGSEAGAPRAIIMALGSDRSDIAAAVLGESPLFNDSELVDAAALGDAVVQAAIARRRPLGVAVAAALAEVAGLPACLALLDNPAAQVPEPSLRRLVERFGAHGEMREALLARPDLSPGLRADLVEAVSGALAAFVVTCGWLSPDRVRGVVRDAQEQAMVTLAADAASDEGTAGPLIGDLRGRGRLTPALLLRALLCGNLAFFEAALGSLSGVPQRRVAGLARGRAGLGFAALYGRAGLPAALRPVFEAALGALRIEPCLAGGRQLRRGLIAAALDACARPGVDEPGQVAALLHRLDAQAAREEARAFAAGVSARAPVLEIDGRAPLLSAA